MSTPRTTARPDWLALIEPPSFDDASESASRIAEAERAQQSRRDEARRAEEERLARIRFQLD